MASPLQPGKQPVLLDAKGVRVSRIRRDPPPVAKKTVVPDRDEVDRRAVAIGVVAFALAILLILVGFGSYTGWSPRDHVIRVQLH